MLTEPARATIIVNSVFPFLAILAVAIRLYARRLKHLTLRVDDYTILVALVITVAGSMPYIYGATNGGMGKHIEDLTYEEFVNFGKITFATQFTYIFAVSLIKISILLFYKSIFTTRRFAIAANTLGVGVLLWTISFFFASLFQASPIPKNWYPSLPGSTINEFAMYWAAAATELFLDVATLVLPWTIIWKLHMSTSRKWIVSGIFMLGGFICISSAIRLYYLINTKTSATEDFTYDLTNIFIWTAIEPCMGVICACLPTLGPVFQGGHSPESLLGSFKSYLQLLSRSNRSKSSVANDVDRKKLEQVQDSPARSFHRMPEDAIISTNVHGRQLNDVENQMIPAEGIVVHTKLCTSDDGSRMICR